MTNEEVIRLVLEVGGKEQLSDLAAKANSASDALKNAGDATDKLTTSTGNSGRSILEFGRIAQDFAQGGVGGIINNLEGFATALGTGPGVAGMATLAGVAFLVLKPAILSFIDSMNEADEATKPLKERLENVGKALETLTAKTKLNNEETAEYNRLAQEQGKLDKESADNKAKLAAMAAQPRDKAFKSRTIGEMVTDVAAGKQAEIVAQAAQGLSGPAMTEFTELHGQRLESLSSAEVLSGPQQAEMEFLRKHRDSLVGQGNADAQALLTKAMAGDVEAARKLISVLPQGAIRDDLVRATIGDRVKADAKTQAGQFLQSTLGAGAQDIRDRNAAARAAGAAADNTANIDQFTDRARQDRDQKEQRDEDREFQARVKRTLDLSRRAQKAMDQGPSLAMPQLQPITPQTDETGETMRILQQTQQALARQQANDSRLLAEIREKGRDLTKSILRRGR